MNNSSPRILVVGSGLAGLLCCFHIKKESPAARVILVEKPQSQSNTQIAGMRFRLKQSGSQSSDNESCAADIVRLLSEQNGSVTLPQMEDFANTATVELATIGKLLKNIDPSLVTDNKDWFGPQWGIANQSGEGGRGASIIRTLRTVVKEMGVEFAPGEVIKLAREKRVVEGVWYKTNHDISFLAADEVVLANGNAGGALYESTNKVITHSATELLFDQHLSIEGGTLNMWHPFGRCTKEGQARNGCYETDSLAGAKIFLADGTYDPETTSLLAEHQAHYHFSEISSRIIRHGSQARIHMESGEVLLARVSLHYSHLGGSTLDGSRIKQTDNLYVVGDAGGFLHWSGNRPRLPGFALTHCLVSAKKTAEIITRRIEGSSLGRRPLHSSTDSIRIDETNCASNELRQVNTKWATQLQFGELDKARILQDWEEDVARIDVDHTLSQISLGIITAWKRRIGGEQEPLPLNYEFNPEHTAENRELKPLRRRL